MGEGAPPPRRHIMLLGRFFKGRQSKVGRQRLRSLPGGWRRESWDAGLA